VDDNGEVHAAAASKKGKAKRQQVRRISGNRLMAADRAGFELIDLSHPR
jgi:hypothetical protein